MTRCAVITTLNEAAYIGELVSDLRRNDWRVIVIDDGSTDGTQEQAARAGADVMVLQRVGIGPALLYGWRYALSEYAPAYILQIDAGGSHDPAEARRLVHALNDGADMVIGSRFVKGAAYIGGLTRRRVMSQAAALACNIVQEAWVRDWTSGYRLFTADAAAALLQFKYWQRMHGWQIAVLARAHQLGLRVVEVPITYRAGRSSFNFKVADEAFGTWLDIMHHYPPKRKVYEQPKATSIPAPDGD